VSDLTLVVSRHANMETIPPIIKSVLERIMAIVVLNLPANDCDRLLSAVTG